MNAVLSDKGQITIPKKLRDDLGLIPGSILDFHEEDGCIVVRKVLVTDPVAKWRGKGRLPGGLMVDAYLDQIRHSEP